MFFLGVGATLPALPGGVRDAGASPAALGIVIGAFAFGALAGRLIAGRSTDRMGRLVTLRAGLVCTAVAGVLFVLALPVAALVAARLLHGLADALVYTAAATWILDRSAGDRRAVALSLLGSGIWGGYALGPLLGGLLGLRGTGVAIVVAAAVSVVLTLGLVDRVGSAEAPAGLRGFLPHGVTVPGIALGLGNLGYAAVVGFLVLQVDDRGGRGAVALSAFSVAVLLGRLVIVPAAVRVGLLRSVPYGLVAMAGGLVVIALADSTLVAATAAAVVGLGYCLPFPALAALVADRVGEAQRGTAVGALTAFYDVFVGLGSVGFGYVAQVRESRDVFLLAALGVLAAAAVDAYLAREDRRVRVARYDSVPDA